MLILAPKVFGDARGFFLESFNQRRFDAAVGATVTFVQDNHSRSARGVLRGLHLQIRAARAGQARARDAAAACSTSRSTSTARARPSGRWVGVELDDDLHRQLWIPPGYAHGFLVLSESADFLYKTTDYYAPADEVDDPLGRPDAGDRLARRSASPTCSRTRTAPHRASMRWSPNR